MPRSPVPRIAPASAPKRRAKGAGRRDPSGSLGEVSQVEVDREPDEPSEAQRTADAAAPQLDPVDRAVRPDRVTRREVIGGASGGSCERRGDQGLAFAERFERRESLAPPLFFALMRIAHVASIGGCGAAIQSVKTLTPPP